MVTKIDQANFILIIYWYIQQNGKKYICECGCCEERFHRKILVTSFACVKRVDDTSSW